MEERHRVVGERELVPTRDLLEETDGLGAHSPRLFALAWAPENAAEPAECRAFPRSVTEFPVTVDRGPQRPKRLVGRVGEIALVRVSLQQACSLLERQLVCEAERPTVLGGRLAVGSEGGCALRGFWGEAKRRIGVPCCVGVVCETGGVA